MHDQFTLQELEANGITLRAAVEGEGPLVIMVHGWPELWYSWRHQIKPIAQAGYRVVVPDLRGYGGNDKPHELEAYGPYWGRIDGGTERRNLADNFLEARPDQESG